jgi:hypothetical protein
MRAAAGTAGCRMGMQWHAVREQARSCNCSSLYEDFQRNSRALRTPRSGGLVEAEFQGLSDMDVARAAMGQGWPFAAGP